MVMESSLLNRYVNRAYRWLDKPHTQESLKSLCKSDIARSGPEARSSVYLKGALGQGLKKHRRLFPNAPLGEVVRSELGMLQVEFDSLHLLAALGSDFDADAALASYYLNSIEKPYPKNITAELVLQFSQSHIEIEIDLDIAEALIAENVANEVTGNAYLIFIGLFQIERVAVSRRWKRVDLQKWRDAKLGGPLWGRPAPRTRPPVEVGTLYRVKDRHAKLLRLFEQADEAGKLHIEQAAAFAAAKRKSAVEPAANA